MPILRDHRRHVLGPRRCARGRKCEREPNRFQCSHERFPPDQCASCVATNNGSFVVRHYHHTRNIYRPFIVKIERPCSLEFDSNLSWHACCEGGGTVTSQVVATSPRQASADLARC